MGIPFCQKLAVARYILDQKRAKEKRFPLVLMLEPLFQCNLNCVGCGKTDYPKEILERRLGLDECIGAADECGAPIVSIAGGEPLIHEEMPEIVRGLIRRRKFVYLCTNGLLLGARLKDYVASRYLTLSVHLDGGRDRHDALARQPGVYDRAVEAIRAVCEKGFRVTVNATLYKGATASEIAAHFDFVMNLGVEGITVSPAYPYAQASRREVFLSRTRTQALFREIIKLRHGRGWRFNHSGLYLDFLAGNRAYQCTPWGNPTRTIFGWQKPCYLLAHEGYASTFKALLDETDWNHYGPGRNPKCNHCMLHSGFEATAVNDTLSHPLRALRVYLCGPALQGPLISQLPSKHAHPASSPRTSKPAVSEEGREVCL